MLPRRSLTSSVACLYVRNRHSDFPYHPGKVSSYQETFGSYPTEIPFGLQFNTCITDFNPENGATCFKLGSRDLNRGPAPDWSSPHTYAGPEATQFDAPAGTVILYDARVWHRQGMNLTGESRVATLNACIPSWIVGMDDHAEIYSEATADEALMASLTEREKADFTAMMSARM